MKTYPILFSFLLLALRASGAPPTVQNPGSGKLPLPKDQPTLDARTLGDAGGPRKKVDLRPTIDKFRLAVREQGSRPTCSVFATAFLIDFMHAKTSGTAVVRYHSIEYLNTAANLATGTKDDGDYFESLIAGYEASGIVSETELPYKTSFDPSLTLADALVKEGQGNRSLLPKMIRPNDETWGITEQHLNQIVSYLDNGIPVAAGFKIADSRNLQRKTIGDVSVWTSLKNPASFGGHSMALVGYSKRSNTWSDGYFIVRNSARNTGDQGYVYISMDYARANVADLAVFEARPPGLAMRTIKLSPKRRPIFANRNQVVSAAQICAPNARPR